MKLVKYTLLSFALSFALFSHANESELKNILSDAKTVYIKPEALDRLIIRLRPIEENLNPDLETDILEAYKVISDQYAANHHYSQALDVFKKYIQLKDFISGRDYLLAIKFRQDSVKELRTALGAEIMNLKNEAEMLQIDNDYLVSKKQNFKKYFSFIIITLSAIFALMLTSFAVKYFKLHSQINEFRDAIKNLHGVATLGSLSQGFISNTNEKINQLEEMLEQLKNDVSHSPGKIDQMLTGMKNELKDFSKKLGTGV